MLMPIAATAGEHPAFPTKKAAIEHYRKALEDGGMMDLDAINQAFGVETDPVTALMNKPDMRRFIQEAGSLKHVESCLAPPLGDAIQRAGYLAFYERNVAFVDTWLIHRPDGWRLVGCKASFNPNITDTLERIPAPYFQTKE